MSELIEIKPSALARGQEIFLKADGGSQHLKATFLQTGDGIDFSASLEGSQTGFRFLGAEWDIFVTPQYPLPEKTDIETTIYNLITQGQLTGTPPSFGDMAAAVISLIKGEVQIPVPVLHIPQETTPQQEQEFLTPDEALESLDADIDILEGIEGSDLEGFGSRN